MHVQRMLKLSKGLYTGGNFKQFENIWKKNEEKFGTLFTFMIWQINDLVQTNL